MDRLSSRLDADALGRARDAAGVALLVVDGPPAGSEDVAGVLRSRGAFAFVDAERLLVAAPRSALVTAAERLTGEPRAVVLELLRAMEADRTPPAMLRVRDRVLDLGPRALVMAILNVTPDSFYDRGRYRGVDAARERAEQLVALGADAIDVGGQSYAHWNPTVEVDEEIARVVPVVEALVRDGIGVPLSIDTHKAAVADAALAAGAHLINDCSGLADPAVASVVARYRAGLVVMHLKGELNVRAERFDYGDAMGEISAFLRERTDAAAALGVARDALVVDPGLEFGKEPRTDLEILAHFGDLRSLGYPILFAASRKSFIGRVFDRPSSELLVPSLATAAAGILAGAALVRVHDVAETRDVARMLGAMRDGERERVPIAARMPDAG